MSKKDIPMFHKSKKTEHGYTYHCPVCDTLWKGYPVSGRCKNCGQLIEFEEFKDGEFEELKDGK